MTEVRFNQLIELLDSFHGGTPEPLLGELDAMLGILDAVFPRDHPRDLDSRLEILAAMVADLIAIAILEKYGKPGVTI